MGEQPHNGSWHPVAASSDVPDGVMHPFEHGSLIGFVRRVGGRPEAVSGICTHQGCWLCVHRSSFESLPASPSREVTPQKTLPPLQILPRVTGFAPATASGTSVRSLLGWADRWR